jgi:hypothetical protein
MRKLVLTQILVLMLLPTAAFAQTTVYPTPSTVYPPSSSGGSVSVQNPLSVGSFCGLLQKILNAIVAIGIPVAVLFLVIAGFKFILARGKPEALTEARRNLLNVIIGIAIFIGAWAIVQVIVSTMAQFGVTLAACSASDNSTGAPGYFGPTDYQNNNSFGGPR